MFISTYLQFLMYQVIVAVSKSTDEHKCKMSDSPCLIKIAQNFLPNFTSGIQELNVDTLDVMVIDKITIDVMGFELGIMNTKVAGLSKSLVKKISFDMENKTFQVEYLANVFVEGKYNVSGKMIILPITGDGDFTFEINQMFVKFKVPFEIEKNQDGKDVIELKNNNFIYEVLGYLRVHFDNLYNGNTFLSDILHKYINKNWKEAKEVFGEAILRDPFQTIYGAMKNFLKSQPIETLFSNE